jgi:hypothetical protein
MLDLGQNIVPHHHARGEIDYDREWFARLSSSALQNLGKKFETCGRGSVGTRL